MGSLDIQPTDIEIKNLGEQSTGQILNNLREITVGSGSEVFRTVAGIGSFWGGQTIEEAKAYIKFDGSFKFKDASGNTLLDSLGAGGNYVNLINSVLNTQTKQILGEFTFGASGAIAIAADGNNGLWLSSNGLLGKRAGATTFAIDTSGNATFAGALSAVTGSIGSLTGGKITVGGDVVLGDYDGAHRGLLVGSPSSFNNIFIKRSDGVVFFRVNQGGAHSITFDSESGVLALRGQLNADDIVAGTITGRTLRTAAPAPGVGRSVVITGGANQDISFYYDEVWKSYIGGYVDGDAGEPCYLKIAAASGMYLKFQNSMIACHANFNPSNDDSYDLGTSGQRWRTGYFKRLYATSGYSGTIYVATSKGGSPTKKLDIDKGVVYDY